MDLLGILLLVIVGIIVSVLNVILFFKIWNACNNIQRITDKYICADEYADANANANANESVPSNTSIQSTVREYKEDDTYKIGDVVSKNGVVSVVFEVTDDGKHGKMVCAKELVCANWSSDANEQKRLIGTNNENGMSNMSVVKQIDNWQSKYPAFALCADLGEGWYLPAKEELLLLNGNIRIINKSLQAIKAPKLNKWYWSSTEASEFCAWFVNMDGGGTYYFNKGDYYYVRAVSAF